ncbi:putative glutamyl-tRNA(Gln) amidotransferase subunit A [Ochrobactrum phage vB_OspM_OC]|nr:putative glutamyl-tRNA(Gln) amidotransferase subunit A [Ochrobactrum phage vB_OspM_OC]
MTIYEKIKVHRDEARKIGHRLGVTYQTIIGEIERKLDKDKQSDDSSVVTILKSLHKNWQETYTLKPSDDLAGEIEALEKYLPKMLSDDEILAVAETFKTMTMGDFMKYMKATYPNQYDGKKATEIFKSL